MVVVISIVWYFADRGEYTMLYKITKMYAYKSQK